MSKAKFAHEEALTGAKQEAAAQEVLQMLAADHPGKEIVEMLRTKYGWQFQGQDALKVVRELAENGLIVANTDYVNLDAKEVKRANDKLKGKAGATYLRRVNIAPSTVEAVTRHGAEMIMSWLGTKAWLAKTCDNTAPERREEIHIGFGGGNTVKMVVKQLAEFLAKPVGLSLPKKIVCHALVGGIDVRRLTDPSSSFAYLLDSNIRNTDIEFWLLPAQAMTAPSDMQTILHAPLLKKVSEMAKKLDLIVLSASPSTDMEHSQLCRYYSEHDESTLTSLEQNKWVGDILWQPLYPSGPADMSQLKYRATSLVELSSLPILIKGAKPELGKEAEVDVFMIVGPCASDNDCECTKSDVVETLLRLPDPYMTGLVIDCRTVEQVLTKFYTLGVLTRPGINRNFVFSEIQMSEVSSPDAVISEPSEK